MEFQDEYGIQTEDITTVNSVFIKIRKAILPEEFFSCKILIWRLYEANKYLINKYSLIIPKYNVKYKNIVQEVKNRDMEKYY